MSLREEFFACLALRHTPGLGPKSWSEILNSYTTAYEALKDCRSWADRGFTSESVAHAAEKELWRKKAESEYKEALKQGFGILPWTHFSFPESLKKISDPPPYIYYYGNPELLKNPSVAVVGSRKCSDSGLAVAGRLSFELSSCGITVVSGFARGIDARVHEEALKRIGSTIAVLGTGLDVVDYPSGSVELREKIIENGLMISEFVPSTRPYAGNFPFRNRIISALSAGVIVAEASVKSGSLITARLAGEQGREVMAVPGPPGDARFSGCLKLIKEGAALVESVEDVLCTIGYALDSSGNFSEKDAGISGGSSLKPAPEVKPHFNISAPGSTGTLRKKSGMRNQNDNAVEKKEPDTKDLNADQLAFVGALKESGKLHIDELSRMLEWEGGKTGGVALELEVRGVIARYPGMYYSL
ncbi:DNA-processing protein DprA [Maridesulfovibrio bastinii]|uniref:DNA-processing protein DprA n=1 Tax=Maridesulfovibrio bastinii TaxID=47157 RepID=UPI00041B5348|nr:DNA-processing protein DprA [Maridesulfovibrio bastinii]